MTVNVEPIEVLAHLHQMGYFDISAEQLMAFIADLKKLIKYDTRKCNCNNYYMSKELDYNDHSLVSLDKDNITSYTQIEDLGIYNDQDIVTVCERKKSLTKNGFEKRSKECFVHAKRAPHNTGSSARTSSAFIKPWQIHGQPFPKRSDPVSLYHKYQAVWQKQKVPGDNRHEILRWKVREKMLACDPMPHPVSLTTSLDRVNRPGWSNR